MLIRSKTIANNVGGRGGCLLSSPYSGGIYYVSIEHGRLYVRDWAGAEKAQDGPVTLAGPQVSASFANPTQVCVTVAGFHPNSNDSGMDTYILDVPEGT